MVTLDFAASNKNHWMFKPKCPSCGNFNLTIKCVSNIALEAQNGGLIPSIITDQWDYTADESQEVTCNECKQKTTLKHCLKAGKSGQLRIGRKHAAQ